ncbi:MAG TPA: PKD domain-containing protein [Thermoanaerobaculia bacterium]|nr:PKD domain-containing protein [Thermoanaerobaculia bacterium]
MHNFRPRLGALGAALLALPLATSLAASEFYAAPNGTHSGSGSVSSPWDLSTALAQPAAVKPGDTIWLRGGTYTGHFTSTLKGEKGRPIVVRQYPGERATIDGNYGGNEVTLIVNGRYAWFWGFEVTNSDPTRVSPTTDNPTRRGTGTNLLGPGTKLINVVIHDTVEGVLTTALAPDAEVYGSLIYYNGYDGPDRGHGHGVYVQNDGGTKRIADNVIFGQFGIGIHGYTESGKLDDIHIEGNTSFANGVLSQVSGPTIDILVGANGSKASSPNDSVKVAKRTYLVSNYTYFAGDGTAVNLGYSKGIASPTLIDNYFVGSQALAFVNAFRPITMTGNSIFGSLSGLKASEFPSNTFFAARPTGVKVFVRKNQYEPGRANVTIYNWDRAATATVPLDGVLDNGTDYELRNAQNFFGPPVLSGTYQGAPLVVPLSGLAAAVPVGLGAQAATGPDFQVFVLLPKRPPASGKPPAAAFSFGPRAPLAGDAVAFASLSTGSVDSVAWDFGDPASGAANASALASPTHAFSGPGAYTVRLTASNASGASVRTREVVVTDQTGLFSATLPVAGHVTGSTGTTFVTDVAVSNGSAASAAARLVFTPGGGGAPQQVSLPLAPGESKLLADVVASQFGTTDALGSLRLEADGVEPSALRVAGRTYVAADGGTLGLGAAGLSGSDGAAGDRYISNLAADDDFRTNIGALNPTGAAQGFTIELSDQAGNLLGRVFLALDAGAQQQWGLTQLFPNATGRGMTARIIPASDAAAPLAYAAVTDNVSSDPTYYAAIGASPVQFVPGVAAVTGIGSALFTSEIAITNANGYPVAVTISFLEHDKDNTAAASKTLTLAPGETLHADDALGELFGESETYGALRIASETSPGVAVFERILTTASSGDGTVGQQVDSLSAESLLSSGALLGIRNDSAFRTNVGLFNPSASGAPVTLTLRRSPDTVLGTRALFLPGWGYTQANLTALFPAASIPEGEALSISVDGGAQSVYAFASVIDNVSKDPTFYPELP